jgi:hypothetical protein
VSERSVKGKNMIKFALVALMLGAMPTMAMELPTCPPAIAEAPAASTFGPYPIEGFGTAAAAAYGLPSCEEAFAHLQRLLAATAAPVITSIEAEANGTYTARIEPL